MVYILLYLLAFIQHYMCEICPCSRVQTVHFHCCRIVHCGTTFIHSSGGRVVVSGSGLVQIVLLWTFQLASFGEQMYTLVLHAYLGIGLLSHRLQLFRVSGCCQRSKMAVLTLPPTVCQSFNCSTTLPKRGILFVSFHFQLFWWMCFGVIMFFSYCGKIDITFKFTILILFKSH